MKKLFTICMTAIITVAGLNSCEDNKTQQPDPLKQPDNLVNSTLSPSQQQQRLEAIGKEFLSNFNAENQQALVQTLLRLYSIIPTDDSDNNEEFPTNTVLESGLPEILLSVSQGDMSVLTRSVANPAMTLKLSEMLEQLQFSMIFDSQTQQWNAVPASQKRCFTLEWDDSKAMFSWSSAEQSWQGTIVDQQQAKIYVPEKIDMSVQISGQRHLEISVKPGIKSNTVWEPRITVKLNGGLALTVTSKADQKGVQVVSVLSNGDKNIASAAARMVIDGITDTEKWFSEVEYTWEDENGLEHTGQQPSIALPQYVTENIETGQVAINILTASLYMQGNIGNILSSVLNSSEGELPSQETQAKMLAALIDINMKSYLYYTDTREKVADIYMHAYMDAENTWGIEPVMSMGDGSQMSIKEFFDSQPFASLMSSVQAVLQSYKNLIPQQ